MIIILTCTTRLHDLDDRIKRTFRLFDENINEHVCTLQWYKKFKL